MDGFFERVRKINQSIPQTPEGKAKAIMLEEICDDYQDYSKCRQLPSAFYIEGCDGATVAMMEELFAELEIPHKEITVSNNIFIIPLK